MEDLPESEAVEKPYLNEHACRLNDPGKYEKFRRGKRTHEGKVYAIIFGKPKDKDTWEEQAYRYAKDTWTAAQAKKHCASHGGKFEAAKTIDDAGECEECKNEAGAQLADYIKRLIRILDSKIESRKERVKLLSGMDGSKKEK